MSSSFSVCRGPVSSRYTGYFTVPQLYHRVAVDGPDSRDVTCGVLYRTLSRSYCTCSRFFLSLSLSRFVTCVCRPSRTLRGNMIPRHKGIKVTTMGNAINFGQWWLGKEKKKRSFSILFYSFSIEECCCCRGIEWGSLSSIVFILNVDWCVFA